LVVAEHFNAQVAPADVVSFFTRTPRTVLCKTWSELGGAGLNTIVTGGFTMVKVTLLAADGLLVAAAVTLTVLPIGT
jgi:hypothetical protein